MARTSAYNFCDEDFRDLEGKSTLALLNIADDNTEYAKDIFRRASRNGGLPSTHDLYRIMAFKLRAEVARELAHGASYALALTIWLGTMELPKRVK